MLTVIVDFILKAAAHRSDVAVQKIYMTCFCSVSGLWCRDDRPGGGAENLKSPETLQADYKQREDRVGRISGGIHNNNIFWLCRWGCWMSWDQLDEVFRPFWPGSKRWISLVLCVFPQVEIFWNRVFLIKNKCLMFNTFTWCLNLTAHSASNFRFHRVENQLVFCNKVRIYAVTEFLQSEHVNEATVLQLHL